MKVKIGRSEYAVYADLETADTYLNASVAADDWDGTPPDDRKRALVEATRFLDRQRWAQSHETVEQRASELRVVHACIEIAALVAQGATAILSASSTNDMVKSIKAGSVAIEYSGKTAAAERFPRNIAELLAGLVLDSSAGAGPRGLALGGGLAYGTDTVSSGGDSYGVTGA